jgi:hypothetical protein
MLFQGRKGRKMSLDAQSDHRCDSMSPSSFWSLASLPYTYQLTTQLGAPLVRDLSTASLTLMRLDWCLCLALELRLDSVTFSAHCIPSFPLRKYTSPWQASSFVLSPIVPVDISKSYDSQAIHPHFSKSAFGPIDIYPELSEQLCAIVQMMSLSKIPTLIL